MQSCFEKSCDDLNARPEVHDSSLLTTTSQTSEKEAVVEDHLHVESLVVEVFHDVRRSLESWVRKGMQAQLLGPQVLTMARYWKPQRLCAGSPGLGHCSLQASASKPPPLHKSNLDVSCIA